MRIAREVTSNTCSSDRLQNLLAAFVNSQNNDGAEKEIRFAGRHGSRQEYSLCRSRQVFPVATQVFYLWEVLQSLLKGKFWLHRLQHISMKADSGFLALNISRIPLIPGFVCCKVSAHLKEKASRSHYGTRGMCGESIIHCMKFPCQSQDLPQSTRGRIWGQGEKVSGKLLKGKSLDPQVKAADKQVCHVGWPLQTRNCSQ